jgi:putative ABC transport system ATP-binding protein
MYSAVVEHLLLATRQIDAVDRPGERIRRSVDASALHGDPAAWLQDACRAVGLRAEHQRVPLKQVFSWPADDSPVVVASGAALVVISRDSDRGLTAWSPVELHAGLCTGATLRRLLALPDDTAEVEMWIVQASLPMHAMSSLGPGALDEQEEAASEVGLALHHGSLHGHGAAHGPGWHGRSPVGRLIDLARLERKDVAVVFVYAAFVGLLTLATPLAMQALVSSVAFGTVLQPLFILALVLLGGTMLSALLQALENWIVEIMQWRIVVRLVGDLSSRLPKVRSEALDAVHAPELVNRFFDIFTVQKTASWLLLEGLGIMLTAVVGMLLLASYHPILLGFDVVLIACAAFVLFGLGRGGVYSAIKESKAKHALAGWLEELVRHPLTFRQPGATDFARERADELTRDYLYARKKHFSVVYRQILGSLLLQALASAALLGVGGFLVIREQLTLGQLVAAELATTAIVSSIAKLGRYLENLYDMLAAVDKVGSLLDLPVERVDGVRAPDAPHGGSCLRLRHLRFGWHESHPLLSNINFELKTGERVALTGSHGAGKSTLLELMTALRSAHAGSLELNGCDLRDLSIDDVRRRVSLVAGPEIVAGTLFDNIALGRPGIGMAEVRDAMTRLGLDEEVACFSHGLNTSLLTGGLRLSTGQSVLITLARAMVGRPDVLLLDGVLDTLDPETRHRVGDVLLAPTAPWSVVLVTNDLELIRRCERRIQLEGGVLR